MKKYVVLAASLMIALAACTTQPPAANAPANANSSNANAKSTAPVSEADATAREKAVWESIKKKDLDGFASALSSDYIEIGGDGIYDKPGIVAYLKDLNLSDATFTDWKVLPIDKDALIVTYNVTLKGKYKNDDIPAGPYRAGAAWVNRDGKWVVAFYQETLIAPAPTSAPKPPPPASTASPKSSPAVTPAVTGPDPTANEKMVWDALKAHNSDQFAAFLTSDFVEVEEDGVFDKAASVKSVSTIDLSKSVLSEWKSTKLDADAALVTYLATIPGAKPPKARHSTIWVNRDGKWLALYHQGSPVRGEAAPAKPATSPK